MVGAPPSVLQVYAKAAAATSLCFFFFGGGGRGPFGFRFAGALHSLKIQLNRAHCKSPTARTSHREFRSLNSYVIPNWAPRPQTSMNPNSRALESQILQNQFPEPQIKTITFDKCVNAALAHNPLDASNYIGLNPSPSFSCLGSAAFTQ